MADRFHAMSNLSSPSLARFRFVGIFHAFDETRGDSGTIPDWQLKGIFKDRDISRRHRLSVFARSSEFNTGREVAARVFCGRFSGEKLA